MSYWRQFEHGMLSRDATRKLQECTEIASDHKGKYVTLCSKHSPHSNLTEDIHKLHFY